MDAVLCTVKQCVQIAVLNVAVVVSSDSVSSGKKEDKELSSIFFELRTLSMADWMSLSVCKLEFSL